MKKLSALILAIAACSAHASPVVGGTPSFTAVRTQLELAGCPAESDPACVVGTGPGASFTEIGSPSGAYAEARAGLGVNGAYASVDSSRLDLEAYAESIWADAFVIRGGTGSATVHVSVRVDGWLDGAGQPGGPGSNAFYALFIGDAPMFCEFDALSCGGRLAIPLTEPLSGTQVLGADIPFTYDQPFYVASYLGAEVVGGAAGVADFFHSAHFGISAPTGATLTAESGTLYPAVVSVPEPAAVWLLLLGLPGAVWVRFSRPADQ
jgi:hypothetical protein